MLFVKNLAFDGAIATLAPDAKAVSRSKSLRSLLVAVPTVMGLTLVSWAPWSTSTPPPGAFR